MSKEKNRVKRSNVIRIVIALVILVAMIGTSVFAAGFTRDAVYSKMDKLADLDVKKSRLDIDKRVAKDLENYTNILLLGIDTRDVKSNEGSRSDAMILVSINNETSEIKLASIFRDSYLYIPAEKFCDKVTHAHAYGGAEEAMKTLNRNLDLNIDKVMVVNWGSVAKAVDTVGGLTVKIRPNEIDQMNIYIGDTRGTIGGERTHIDKAGLRKLNGVEAATYARIRKGASGGDKGRARRMRTLLKAAIRKARSMPADKINKAADEILPQIQTNMDNDTLSDLLIRFTKYKINGSFGWPFDYDGWYSGFGWYDVPITLKSNVVKLHKRLFGQKNYKPTDRVIRYSRMVSKDTGWYKKGDNETTVY